MTLDEVLKVFGILSSTGVLAGGWGLCKWGFGIERRMIRLEMKNGIRP
jgi:hypothetical protein